MHTDLSIPLAKVALPDLTYKVLQWQMFSSDLTNSPCPKVYPSFNKEAPNLQIFLSTAAKVLSVRTLAANWGMISQSNITITEHLQGHSNSILAMEQIGVVLLHLPHTWQRTYNNVLQHSFQKLPDKASGSLSELQAPFPGYRNGQQRTKPCAIEP